MSEAFPTLTELISQLEEHQRGGIKAIEYRVDELLAVLRWNNTPEGHAQNRSAAPCKEAMELIEVLEPQDREVALRLFLKAVRINQNAELVEAWLASVNRGSEQ